ncbi:MAG TPA: 3-hydroxybutyryl-CoA dehydrogenase [Saprospiraceae bacterium]|nr:3-hydroxybutyryl-CoA dehydrogenase [Saprospiraceae bacterium]
MEITKVTVIGAGTMGNGIAHVFAQAGYSVSLADIDQNALDRAVKTIEGNLDRMVRKEKITEETKVRTLKRITTLTSLESAIKDSGLVVEAATENRDLKRKIFQQLDTLCPPDVIFATNTSSISITEIASATKRSAQVIGMHFMNPVPVMKLVEIIRGYDTSDEVTEIILNICKKLDKTALVVNDYPGFVANRILMPMVNEAIITLHEGVAGVYEIDNIMKLGMAHPMGPLELADFIGLDVCLAILRVLHEGLGNPKYAPCPLLVNMVNAGKLGRKSGEGFYSYTSGTPVVSTSL